MTETEFAYLANGVLVGWLIASVVILVGMVAYQRWGR